MLSLKNVTKRYGKILANHNVSIDIPSGEIAVLLGPNGAGKSTLIKSICGLLRYEGEISLDITGKKPGRGAYICPCADCLIKAKKARRLEKAFSCQIPDEIYGAMEEELKHEQG